MQSHAECGDVGTGLGHVSTAPAVSHQQRKPRHGMSLIAQPEDVPNDSGITLAELMVAIAILSVVIVVFLAGMVGMTRATVRTEVTSDKVSQMRTFFQQSDREVRYARDINRPGMSNGSYYVEYVTVAPDSESQDMCVQLRYVPGEGEIQKRTWPESDSGEAGEFRTVVTQLRNDLSDPEQVPFVFYSAERNVATSVTYVSQRLGLFFDAGLGEEGDGRGSQLDVVLTARNSSDLSQTHNDNDLDGVTDDPVCTPEVGRP